LTPQGSIYNERTAVIIPTQQTALKSNEVIKVHIPLESVKSEVEIKDEANQKALRGYDVIIA